MQKVVDFLEKYCQWLAVGIAALFFLFALWQFVPGISAPVTAEINGAQLGPGEVDPAIEETSQQLASKIAANDRIKADVPPYGQQFVQASSTPPKIKSPTLPVEAVAARTLTELPEVLRPLSPDQIRGNATVENNQGPQELPKIPAAAIEPPTSGFAQVTDPAAAGAAGAPVQPVIAAPPGQPAAPNANAKDVTWVRVPYVISTRQIQLAFQNAQIPPQMMQTALVRVELVRQRELPGDQWAPEEVVKVFTAGQPLRAAPPAGSPPAVMLEYRNWLFQNQQAIAQPPFFQIVGGEDPNFTKPPEVVQVEIFDPATFPRNGDLSKLTPEQRKQVMEHRRANPVVRQPQQPRGPQGPRGGRGRGGGEPGMMEPRLAPPAPLKPGAVVELQYRPPGTPQGLPQEGMENPDITGEAMAPAVGQAITLPAVPAGPWDLTQAGASLTDVYGVAYDVDARGDSSYRYRVRYSIVNPLYNTQGVTPKQELTQIFEIVGEDKEKWSDPVEVAPRTYVFLASQPVSGATNVRFTIYRWQNGRQHRVIQSVGQGDSIGKPDADIDYRTPWTFVEVRRDPSTNNVYALLMNSEGKLRKHIFQVDKDSPQQKKLAAQVDAANVAAGQAAAAAPGAPAGRPGVGVAE